MGNDARCIIFGCTKTSFIGFLHIEVTVSLYIRICYEGGGMITNHGTRIVPSQFPHGQYAAFGCVMDGMDVVDRIANQPRNMMTNKPKKDQVMAKVTVDTQGVTYPEPEKLADPFGR